MNRAIKKRNQINDYASTEHPIKTLDLYFIEVKKREVPLSTSPKTYLKPHLTNLFLRKNSHCSSGNNLTI